MEPNLKETRQPSLAVSILGLFAIIAVIVIGLKLSIGTQMAVFCGAAVAVIIAMLLGVHWKDIEAQMIETINGVTVANIIIIEVGVLVGIWLIGGALPTLIYYGLGVISPSAIVPLAFVLCAFTSVCTGTSYGSVATMGLALFGIGINMGINTGLLAGAIISGAYFGDKMSPMSDTTNVAPAVSGTNLYSHIYSMLYTTVPATIVVLIMYIVLGLRAASSVNVDLSEITMLRETLAANFNISFVAVIPMILVLVLSILKVPAIIAMGGMVIVSVIFAVATQGASLSAVFGAAFSGYSSNTGISLIDTILNRGGAKSMVGTVYLVMFASVMSAAMKRCGILDVVMKQIVEKVIHSASGLVIGTMLESYLVLLLTGNQTMSILIPGQTFADTYDDFDVDRKVCSRCLEDAGTLACTLVPWSSAAQYFSGVLGIAPMVYIPYMFLGFVVPIFSLICAFTGFGMWDSKGNPKWKKSKTAV